MSTPAGGRREYDWVEYSVGSKSKYWIVRSRVGARGWVKVAETTTKGYAEEMVLMLNTYMTKEG